MISSGRGGGKLFSCPPSVATPLVHLISYVMHLAEIIPKTKKNISQRFYFIRKSSKFRGGHGMFKGVGRKISGGGGQQKKDQK